MGVFTVPVTLSHPDHPDRRLTLDLIVDTGAIYTLLPAEIVQQLGLQTPRQRRVTIANGEQVSYPVGVVDVGLNDEEWPTLFFAGPPGCLGLLGAITLEGFGLAPDLVNKRLVPVVGILA